MAINLKSAGGMTSYTSDWDGDENKGVGTGLGSGSGSWNNRAVSSGLNLQPLINQLIRRIHIGNEMRRHGLGGEIRNSSLSFNYQPLLTQGGLASNLRQAKDMGLMSGMSKTYMPHRSIGWGQFDIAPRAEEAYILTDKEKI